MNYKVRVFELSAVGVSLVIHLSARALLGFETPLELVA